jgi:hypothetical protein
MEDFMDRSLQHAFSAEEIMATLDGELDALRASALASHLLNLEVERAPESLRVVTTSAYTAFESTQSNSAPNPEQIPVRRSLTRRPKKLVWAISAALALILVLVVGKQKQPSDPDRVRTDSERMPSVRTEPEDKLKLSAAAPAPPYSSGNSSYAELLQHAQQAAVTENLENQADRYSPPASGDSGTADDSQSQLTAPEVSGPLIDETVSLDIVPRNYDDASAAIEKMSTERGGYLGSLRATAPSGAAREVSIELRIPARQADALVADLRKLGKVVDETRASDEVTAEYVDLEARMKAAKAAEKRLVELLGTRTGKLSDVLEVERELARVRSEIESMQGQSNVMLNRVTYATVKVQLSEEYHEKLESRSTSTWTKLRNAAIDGTNNLEEAILRVLVFFLDYGLSIAFWLAFLLAPLWFAWRKYRRRTAK